MRLPKTLSIFGTTYRIERVSGLTSLAGDPLDAYIHYDLKLIEVDRGCEDPLKALIHEAGHGICKHLGIDIPIEVEEILVEKYADWLTQTFTMAFRRKKY